MNPGVTPQRATSCPRVKAHGACPVRYVDVVVNSGCKGHVQPEHYPGLSGPKQALVLEKTYPESESEAVVPAGTAVPMQRTESMAAPDSAGSMALGECQELKMLWSFLMLGNEDGYVRTRNGPHTADMSPGPCNTLLAGRPSVP